MPAYSLDGVVITAGGRQLSGFGESDALAYEWANDRVDPVDCCDGAVIFNRVLSQRGQVTLTLRYDSPSMRILAALDNAADSFSFNAVWPNGRVIESGETWVQTRPKPSAGAKPSDEVWVLSCARLEVEYEQGA